MSRCYDPLTWVASMQLVVVGACLGVECQAGAVNTAVHRAFDVCVDLTRNARVGRLVSRMRFVFHLYLLGCGAAQVRALQAPQPCLLSTERADHEVDGSIRLDLVASGGARAEKNVGAIAYPRVRDASPRCSDVRLCVRSTMLLSVGQLRIWQQ